MPATFLNDCVIDLQINISEENYLFSLNIDIYIYTQLEKKISIVSNKTSYNAEFFFHSLPFQ